MRGNCWPTSRYSTSFEFNNSINSRKSLFSGIGIAAVAEFDEDTQALFVGHRSIRARIGLVGILKTGEHPDRFLHAHKYNPQGFSA